MVLLVSMVGCGPVAPAICGCPSGVPGHALVLEEACACLPHLTALPDPVEPIEIALAAGEPLDWAALDAALAGDDVRVRFDPAGTWDRLAILRTDTGPNRLVLDGGGGSARAVVAGILTPYEEGARHRITLRGFEITGSRDKGIYWEAGDDVWIEDVVVHDNRGSPALNLQYSNRSGLPSSGFSVRNSHIYDQNGECVYIGGSEGEDLPSHTDVVIENNLIHDCRDPWDTKHDGINVKDRLSEVRVHRNVVLRTDWGIEVASPGLYTNNLVIDTDREGFQVADGFAPLRDLVFVDNTALRPGHDGFHIAAENAAASGLSLERSTVIGAGEAGLLVASEGGVSMDVQDFVALAGAVGFDGWGRSEVTVEGCGVGGNGIDMQRSLGHVSGCTPLAVPDIRHPAGADGLFFTPDDPWLVVGGAELPAR